MKTLSLIICFSLFINTLQSQNSLQSANKISHTGSFIDKDVALVIARRFLIERNLRKPSQKTVENLSLSDFKTLKLNDEPALYVFSNHGSGFVIISADSALAPVVGYSSEGVFPEKGVSQNFDNYLETYLDQVKWVRENHIRKTPEIKALWEALLEDKPDASANEESGVEPLLTCLWSQGYPYNALCPRDATVPAGHVPAGCAATAMSMLMYYYRYPLHGKSVNSYSVPGYGNLSAYFEEYWYDWDGMLDQINTSSGQSIPAIALLQYHAGVAINMMYSANGSAITNADISKPIIEHFGYNPLMKFLHRYNYTIEDWEKIIVEQLDSLEPVYFTGYIPGKTGHAFICDGYQHTASGLMFHFNFGWGSIGNGYYTISNPNGFTYGQGIMRDCYPGKGYPYGCNNHIIKDVNGSFEDGSSPRFNYNPNLNCTWLIDPADSVTSISLSFKAFSVDESDSVFIYDGANESAPLLGVFTGYVIPPVVTSTGGKIFLKFTSDRSNESKGWMAEYHSDYPDFCSETPTLTSLNGSFSDGSGNRNYNNNGNCKWIIQPQEDAILELSFRSFELEEHDSLKVYSSLSPDSASLLGIYTGKDIPAPLVSRTGSMLVVFETNEFNTGAGFDAEYTSYVIEQNKPVISPDISLWPNPASEYSVLRLNNVQKQNILLSISDLNGRRLYSEKLNCISCSFEENINLGNYNPGIYLLSLKADNRITNYKLVVEKK